MGKGLFGQNMTVSTIFSELFIIFFTAKLGLRHIIKSQCVLLKQEEQVLR